ncbi:MAG TPA: metallophosphoesterase [Thermoanaerobaculia bacterium]|nr:metallophosphoesterase [Thermoanaerobaculia bacterium]
MKTSFGPGLRPTRRDLLRLGGAVVGSAAGLAGCRSSRGPEPAAAAAQTAEPSTPDFTAAFLTDPHVHAEQGAADGFASALDHAFGQERPPELLITGGDLAFDVLATGPEQADAQYALFEQPLRSVRVPVHHTVGNHDVLGVYAESGMAEGDEGYGKSYYLERFGLERPYHSFDHEGWHFVVLDTIGIVGRRYRGWVDEEQLAWLDDDLAASARPTVVVGHIPLLSNYVEWRRGTAEPLPDGVSVVNAHEVLEVLARHPVRLVLAGHLHVVESYRFKGLELVNLGAVSGNWWRGLRDGFEEGYGLLEFRGDEVSWRYVDYGWETRDPVTDAPA